MLFSKRLRQYFLWKSCTSCERKCSKNSSCCKCCHNFWRAFICTRLVHDTTHTDLYVWPKQKKPAESFPWCSPENTPLFFPREDFEWKIPLPLTSTFWKVRYRAADAHMRLKNTISCGRRDLQNVNQQKCQWKTYHELCNQGNMLFGLLHAKFLLWSAREKSAEYGTWMCFMQLVW